MSFSQQNRRLREEPEYRYAFLTTKNGNSIRRFSTCTFVNLQFPFFSVPIWSGRMFMHSITLIIALIARFSEVNKLFMPIWRQSYEKYSVARPKRTLFFERTQQQRRNIIPSSHHLRPPPIILFFKKKVADHLSQPPSLLTKQIRFLHSCLCLIYRYLEAAVGLFFSAVLFAKVCHSPEINKGLNEF